MVKAAITTPAHGNSHDQGMSSHTHTHTQRHHHNSVQRDKPSIFHRFLKGSSNTKQQKQQQQQQHALTKPSPQNTLGSSPLPVTAHPDTFSAPRVSTSSSSSVAPSTTSVSSSHSSYRDPHTPTPFPRSSTSSDTASSPSTPSTVSPAAVQPHDGSLGRIKRSLTLKVKGRRVGADPETAHTTPKSTSIVSSNQTFPHTDATAQHLPVVPAEVHDTRSPTKDSHPKKQNKLKQWQSKSADKLKAWLHIQPAHVHSQASAASMSPYRYSLERKRTAEAQPRDLDFYDTQGTSEEVFACATSDHVIAHGQCEESTTAEIALYTYSSQFQTVQEYQKNHRRRRSENGPIKAKGPGRIPPRSSSLPRSFGPRGRSMSIRRLSVETIRSSTHPRESLDESVLDHDQDQEPEALTLEDVAEDSTEDGVDEQTMHSSTMELSSASSMSDSDIDDQSPTVSPAPTEPERSIEGPATSAEPLQDIEQLIDDLENTETESAPDYFDSASEGVSQTERSSTPVPDAIKICLQYADRDRCKRSRKTHRRQKLAKRVPRRHIRVRRPKPTRPQLRPYKQTHDDIHDSGCFLPSGDDGTQDAALDSPPIGLFSTCESPVGILQLASESFETEIESVSVCSLSEQASCHLTSGEVGVHDNALDGPCTMSPSTLPSPSPLELLEDEDESMISTGNLEVAKVTISIAAFIMETASTPETFKRFSPVDIADTDIVFGDNIDLEGTFEHDLHGHQYDDDEHDTSMSFTFASGNVIETLQKMYPTAVARWRRQPRPCPLPAIAFWSSSQHQEGSPSGI
ncbi:hypothetical protein BC939DRAFT_498313 [Gamsiella multidivaricata]|uniref:uncharacterized protein n=1 Tax=Gamsiella multidivaricata TaxID=101098 RepID=UPI0022200F16|nr:uncharacterized protein BC939DRAFT_498313 [Gamsiella multidivaricata]KAI7832219.1 hypothetical protein BC939DRAFT_498313 [Gamsiella multidivaricata]